MAWNNKVIWSEGLFLQPQHFQQQGRFTERYVEIRSGSLRSYAWGFTELKIDQDLLAIGKLAIASARGVFPDGTPFSIPEDDDAPAPVEFDEQSRNTTVYLSLANRRSGAVEVASGVDDEGLTRYQIREHEARDVSANRDGSTIMQVGSLRTRLLLDKDQRSEYSCLGIARVVECRADKQVVLDDSYISPVMDVQAAPQLAGFLTELQGKLHLRADALAGRVSAAGKGVAELADFLQLQAMNRYEPVVEHMAAGHLLHPEALFSWLLEIAGEFSTFTAASKRPQSFARYRHDDLHATFEPVIAAIRDSLTTEISSNVVPLTLKERRYGIRVAQIGDPALLDQAIFVLAVSADLPVDEIQRRLPAQIKIGTPENIQELVNVQLPGIRIRPLPVAPRQIPFHAGYVYFELDKTGEYWASLTNSGAFAMHISGEFPGIALEFWAIRG